MPSSSSGKGTRITRHAVWMPIALLAAAVSTSAAARHKHEAAPAKAEADPQAKLALDLVRLQPAGLPLIGDALGWIKRCTDTPSVCTVSRGFSLDPVTFPSMKVSFVITPNAGTHSVAVMVPLDQNLKDGFVIHGDGKDGILGSYSRCSAVGCVGDAILTDKAYGTLVAAKEMEVLIVDINGRTVMYQAPLTGLDAAVAGPALTDAEFAKATRAAGEVLVSRMQALQAKTKAEDDAARPDSELQGAAPPAASKFGTGDSKHAD